MPNITFANTKGGSGKTTATLALASELVAAGARVALVEGDPNRPLATWAEGRGAPVVDTPKHRVRDAVAATAILRDVARDQNLVVITTDNDDETVLDWLEAAESWATFVLSDPEGSPNQWMNLVISQADLVIVPFAPTTLDALQVTRTLRQIKQTERMAGKTIPHKVLLTRCNPGAVMTRDERDIRAQLATNNIDLMNVTLADRPAFRGMFKHDALLSELTDADAGGLHNARTNAAAYVEEVIELLRSNEQKEAA
jgi:chromosome partitioning protein